MTIERIDINQPPGGPLKSGCVAHGDWVFLGGVTARDLAGDAAAQTAEVLAIIEGYLGAAGTDKSKVLTAQIWVRDMADFQAMTAVWNDWVDAEAPPARACVSAELYHPDALVEIMVTATR
jgi:enamine deaminase RidA (YjgF/YER057c/UK114 family)